MNVQPFDHGIPLLTEVLSEQEELRQIAETVPEPAADNLKPGISAPAHIIPDAEKPAATPSPAATEPDWDAIEARLTQRILHQVQGKIDHLLEERIAHVLQTALQNALIGMRGALREDLQQSLEHIVAHAVSHELGHLHRPQQ